MTKKNNRTIPYDKIVAMFVNGKTTPEIAKATGFTVKGSDPAHYIRAILTRARISGWTNKDGKRVHLKDKKVVLMTAKKEVKPAAKPKVKAAGKAKQKAAQPKKVVTATAKPVVKPAAETKTQEAVNA